MRPGPLVFALALALSACASEYAYVPRAGDVVTVEGRAGAEYPVPADAPRGSVRVSSDGALDVGNEDERMRALHARVVVTNRSDVPWTFDVREPRAIIDGEERAAAFATAGADAETPVVTIAPGAVRAIDLFFPLDGSSDEVPLFELRWRLTAGAAPVQERTPFERVDVDDAPEPAYEPYYGGFVWGPSYWVNPLYPRWRFAGTVTVGRRWYARPTPVRPRMPHFVPHGHGGGRRR